MHRNSVFMIAILTVVLALPGCGRNAAPPVEDPFPERMELTITDSIGIEMGDSVYVFGAIIDVCHGPAGEILVLDQMICAVRVYDSEGDYITQIGRSGDGPGELRLPLSIACLEDGRIFVNDPMKNSFISYDSSYSYLENITDWSNGPPMDPAGLDGSNYSGMRIGFEVNDTNFEIIRLLGRFSDSTEPDIVYLEDRVTASPEDFSGMLSAMIFAFVHTGDDEGRFFYSPMSSEIYEVFAFDADGGDLFHISQDVPRTEKTPIEIEDEKIYIESWVTRMGASGVVIDWQPDPYRYMIKMLGVDSHDRLWVQRGTDLAPLFDVYDMHGEHLFSAQLPVESRSWKFHIDRYGILAWEEDPVSGFQKLYMIDTPDM